MEILADIFDLRLPSPETVELLDVVQVVSADHDGALHLG